MKTKIAWEYWEKQLEKDIKFHKKMAFELSRLLSLVKIRKVKVDKHGKAIP